MNERASIRSSHAEVRRQTQDRFGHVQRLGIICTRIQRRIGGRRTHNATRPAVVQVDVLFLESAPDFFCASHKHRKFVEGQITLDPMEHRPAVRGALLQVEARERSTVIVDLTQTLQLLQSEGSADVWNPVERSAHLSMLLLARKDRYENLQLPAQPQQRLADPAAVEWTAEGVDLGIFE